MLGIVLTVLLLGAGCTGSGIVSAPTSEPPWKTYQAEGYLISHPENFVVIPATDRIRWTTIKFPENSSQRGSIEIWSVKDLPERPLGNETGTALFPALEGQVGIGKENQQMVRVWNYSGDQEITKILMEILASMKIK